MRDRLGDQEIRAQTASNVSKIASSGFAIGAGDTSAKNPVESAPKVAKIRQPVGSSCDKTNSPLSRSERNDKAQTPASPVVRLRSNTASAKPHAPLESVSQAHTEYVSEIPRRDLLDSPRTNLKTVANPTS